MMTGAWGNYNSNTVTIRSTNSSSSAITILGDASASTSTGCEAAGILLEPTATIEATNGGGISLTGRGGYGGFESNAGIVSFGDSNILANSSPIWIQGLASLPPGRTVPPWFSQAGGSGVLPILGRKWGQA